MTKAAEQLLSKVQKLSTDARVEIAGELLLSLDGEPEFDEGHRFVLVSRFLDYVEGRDFGKSANEVIARVRAMRKPRAKKKGKSK